MKKFVLVSLVALTALFALLGFLDTSTVTAAPEPARKLDKAYFAAGCFWKTQYIFSKVPGVVRTAVGYTGGTLVNPTYEQVCSHTTGHAEVAEIDYDPTKTTYRKLLEVLFTHHDPTTKNRQGPDVGDQYRSAIFYVNDEQKKEALAYIAELTREKKFSKPIVTLVVPNTKFYKAEDYHQNYFAKNGQVCE